MQTSVQCCDKCINFQAPWDMHDEDVKQKYFSMLLLQFIATVLYSFSPLRFPCMLNMGNQYYRMLTSKSPSSYENYLMK